MGSKGERARKPKRRLAKVPKYEEPNTIPLAGLGGGTTSGAGREGHSADHHHATPPGSTGRWFLRMLGLKPKPPRT